MLRHATTTSSNFTSLMPPPTPYEQRDVWLVPADRSIGRRRGAWIARAGFGYPHLNAAPARMGVPAGAKSMCVQMRRLFRPNAQRESTKGRPDTPCSINDRGFSCSGEKGGPVAK
jgi:hypothetical protein